MEDKLYVVRLWDGFDGFWIDVSDPVSHNKALEIWNDKTNDGEKMKSYEDIDYYAIFPAGTKMIFDLNRPMNRLDEWRVE